MKRGILLAVMLLGLAFTGFGQVVGTSVPSGTATVYLYRIDYNPFIYSFVFSRKMSVKFAVADNAPKELPQIASLRKNRYMILKLAPGSYVFDTRQMDDKLKLDLAAGDERYLRFDQGFECSSDDTVNSMPCGYGAGIFEMPASDGVREIKKMRPISSSEVKDKKLVIIPPK